MVVDVRRLERALQHAVGLCAIHVACRMHIYVGCTFVYGPTKENGQWRIKSNLELATKYKSQDTVTVIKIRRLEWIGHVIRMNETRYVKKIFEGKLEGRRGRGRPRLRWIDDVEDDLTFSRLMTYIYIYVIPHR